MRFCGWWFFFLLLPWLTACPRKQDLKDTPKVVQPTDEKKDEPDAPPGPPSDLETIAIKKDANLLVFLHLGDKLSRKPSQDKTWKPVILNPKQEIAFYAKLDPEDGTKLGIFALFQIVVAVYNDTAGFPGKAQISARLFLRRGKNETEILRKVIYARGNNYAAYRIPNVEMAKETPLQKDDIFVLRFVHLSGAGGAVGIGGGIGPNGSHLVVSPKEIGPGYIQYTD